MSGIEFPSPILREVHDHRQPRRGPGLPHEGHHKVDDARKVMNNYSGGLHRIIVYGDRVNAIKDLAVLMKFKVVEEC